MKFHLKSNKNTEKLLKKKKKEGKQSMIKRRTNEKNFNTLLDAICCNRKFI